MRKHLLVVAVVAFVAIVVAGPWAPTSADAKRFRAFVYPDRSAPETSIVVEDFRVNETVWDEGGVQYLWVRGPAGSVKLPLSDISQIEVLKFVGLTQVDWARYDVKVTKRDPAMVHYGTLEIRVLRGVADGNAWYYYPATLKDRGTKFWRIVVNDDRLDPTVPLEEPVAETPLPEPEPMPMPAPARAAVPAPASEFEDLSLEELNARLPLGDVFFDFDQDAIRPDGEEMLARNADWLKRFPSTVVRVEGYADPRGTQEYNVELGERRAVAVREYLIGLGVPSTRLTVASRGAAQAFCAEATEACWARNRRSHFVITAK